MKTGEMLLAQLEREIPATRKAIERVPEGKDDWKPHPKSMPMGYLTALVAGMFGWMAMMIDGDHLDLGLRPPVIAGDDRGTSSAVRQVGRGCAARAVGSHRGSAVAIVATAGGWEGRRRKAAAHHDRRYVLAPRPSPGPAIGLSPAERAAGAVDLWANRGRRVVGRVGAGRGTLVFHEVDRTTYDVGCFGVRLLFAFTRWSGPRTAHERPATA